MALAETQMRTAQSFIDGYIEYTAEAILRTRSHDCVHKLMPATLGWPERNNAEHAEWFEEVKGFLSGLKFEILSSVNDTEQRKTVLHTRSVAETPIGTYRNEYAWFLYLTEDRTKVCRVEEFVDSAYTLDFFAKAQEYRSLQEKKQTSGS